MSSHRLEEFSQEGCLAVDCKIKKKNVLLNVLPSQKMILQSIGGAAEEVLNVRNVFRVRGEPKLNLLIESKGKQKEVQYVFASNKLAELSYMAMSACVRSSVGSGYSPTPLTLFVGSMNMGDAPNDSDLEPWIPRNAFDVYAIGVQECEYKPEKGKTEDHWFKQVEDHLGEGYVRVSGGSLWSIRLIVLIRSELREHLSDIQITSEATGIGHVAGNKGGVGVSFFLGDTSFFFVTSHLAAHQGEVAKRNSDYQEIVVGLSKLSLKNIDVTSLYDHVFWFGDLNYRIDMERDDVIAAVEAQDWETLLSEDQLIKEMAAKNVFVGFEEAAIDFPPTYKYTPGTRDYDTKKMRVPSYTDRILWKTAPHIALNNTSFAPADEIMTSDHSPVYATFETEFTQPFVPLAWDEAGDIRGVARLSNLSGTNLISMDLNGYSDPYVVFFGNAITEGRTATVKKDLNPNWGSDSISLALTVNDEDYLEQQSIIALVMDEDKVSKDDPMGQAWIPLAPALSSNGPWFFTVELTANGLPAGELSGSLEIDLDSMTG